MFRQPLSSAPPKLFSVCLLRSLLWSAVLSSGLAQTRPLAALIVVAPDGNGTVVNTTSGLRADGSAVVGWDYVGTINGASGVYLGNGWVITASHVGASTFTLGATSYSPVANSAVRILNTDPLFANWATDLVVYKVAGVGGSVPNLPPLTLASTAPVLADPLNPSQIPSQVSLISYGLSTTATTPTYWLHSGSTWTQQATASGANFASYPVSGPNVKRWGDNVIGDTGSFTTRDNNLNVSQAIDSYVVQFYGGSPGAEFVTPTQSYNLQNRMVVQSGDSGGGMFVKMPDDTWQLAGITAYYGRDSELPANPPAGVFFSDWSYAIAIPSYLKRITEAQTEWAATGGGNWSATGNWLKSGSIPAVAPSGAVAVAQFLQNITAPSTINLDTNVIVGKMNLNNANALTFTATDAHKLTFDNGHPTTNGIAASLAVSGANHVFNTPLVLADQLNIIVDSAALSLNGMLSSTAGAKILTKSGAGTLNLNASFSFDASGVKVSVKNGQVNFNVGGSGGLSLETCATLSGGVPVTTPQISLANGVTLTVGSINMIGGCLQTNTGMVSLNGNVTATSAGTAAGSGVPAQITGQLALGNTPHTFTVTAGNGGAATDLSLNALLTGGTAAGLIKNGTGVLTLTNSANSFTGGTTVDAGTLIANSPETLGVGGPLAITGTALAKINPSAGLLQVRTLTLASTAKLDLTNNDVLAGSGTVATLADGVRTGAIISSTATAGLQSFAVVSGAEYLALPHTGLGLFDGQSVSSGNVILKYTYQGDANLDGRITMDDYLQLDSGFLFGGSGYTYGDFNYDGLVNVSDYALIDQSFRLQSGVLADTLITLHANWFGASYSAALASLTAVPEPATGLLLLTGLTSLVRRPGRKR